MKPSGVKTFLIQYRNVEGRTRRLVLGQYDELRHFGQAMRKLRADGEHPTGLAAIRLMLLSGFRRMEVLALERSSVSQWDHCVRFPDTKSGAQIRVVGKAAMTCLEAAAGREGSPFVFPADWGDGHFVGVVRVLDRVCAKANLKDVTRHVLRHTFASVAGDLGFSELTIAALLGHSARGVTQGYVHLDTGPCRGSGSRICSASETTRSRRDSKNLEEIASDGRRDWSGSVNGWTKRLIVDDMMEALRRAGQESRISSGKTLSYQPSVMVGA